MLSSGLLWAAPLLLASVATAVASPAGVVPHVARQDALPMWVTVNDNGQGSTITPTVTTVDGSVQTVSPPPSSLTESTTFVVSVGGTTTTTTGLPPVATATGNSEAGAFLVCDNQQGADAPFCQPQDGLVMAGRTTYYVTWDTTFFTLSNASVEVQGNFPSRDNATGSENGNPGFTSEKMSASQGFYVWGPDFILEREGVDAVEVQLVLAAFADDNGTAIETQHLGPVVWVVNSTALNDTTGDGDTDSGGSSHKLIAIPIALSIALAIAVLVLAVLCYRTYRRRGTLPLLGTLSRRRSGAGYGERQSRAQRAVDGGTGKNIGIQLTDRESWSPGRGGGEAPSGQGRNVFREELRRQEQQDER